LFPQFLKPPIAGFQETIFSRPQIHFSARVVSRLKRRASAIFTAPLLRRKPKSDAFQAAGAGQKSSRLR
jgi:hypothetical protein